MKKMIALLLALIMVFSLVACSGSADTAKDTTTTDSTTTDTADTTGSDTTAEPASTEGSVINVCLASQPDTIDPALNSAVDGATMLAHLFSAWPSGPRMPTATCRSLPTQRPSCPKALRTKTAP